MPEKSKQLSWDEYFMSIADVVASRSKDPSSKNGCVIVDSKHRPVSFGYNGMLQGADESKMTLTERPMKYYFSIHSEMNALLFAHRDVTGCTLYNKMASCENCLKYCLQAGITRFVYKQFRVNSFSSDKQKSMNNIDTDEAVVRMLASMPHVETLNISNGNTYIDDILESYPENSPERKRLEKWI
ncbi:cytidine deaminase [Candidatus Saccharibacteria bacterium]|nr:cytidine deaminase [Candidatus Saccharibacteria bacterium]